MTCLRAYGKSSVWLKTQILTYDVGVNLSSYGTVTVSGKTVSSKASENTEESSRSATVTVTQRESGKKLTLDITQNAATIIYEYVFNLV